VPTSTTPTRGPPFLMFGIVSGKKESDIFLYMSDKNQICDKNQISYSKE